MCVFAWGVARVPLFLDPTITANGSLAKDREAGRNFPVNNTFRIQVLTTVVMV